MRALCCRRLVERSHQELSASKSQTSEPAHSASSEPGYRDSRVRSLPCLVPGVGVSPAATVPKLSCADA